MLVIRGIRPVTGRSSETFNYPSLQWFPNTISRAIRVRYDSRVRLVSTDEGGSQRFANIEFYFVDQFSLLLTHLRKVSDMVVEFVEKYV